MAIYHFSAKVISRAAGSSAVAAAAYRSASRLRDERLDRAHDFSNKAGVVHSEILLPEGAFLLYAEERKVAMRRLGSNDSKTLTLDEVTALLVDEAEAPDLKRAKVE